MLPTDPHTTLEDRIARKVASPGFHDWRRKVTATNGCAVPVRLFGAWQLHDITTRKVLAHHGGDIMVPCGNRRSAVCPSCSDRYAADAYHLMHAGLAGGSKGVPISVTHKPRAFATVTAPSFGPVHNRSTKSGKTRPCTGCGDYHHEADPRLGTPIDPDTYDYVGSVLWQANAGALWHRLRIALIRELANAAGLTAREFAGHARLSYAKVAEYQRRGLVHFHAVIRVDGPDGPSDATPTWVTSELLDACIKAATASVRLTVARPDGVALDLCWGSQVDVRPIRATQAHEVEDEDGSISETRLAAYVAKYATKTTGTTAGTDRPIRSQLCIDHAKVSDHHRRIMQTAWDLGGLPQYADLKTRRWAHMLGFRGHFLSKSKHYSTTFKSIRDERRDYRHAETLERLGLEPDSVLVINDWAYQGSGYDSDAERELAAALAVRIRDDRRRKYEQEQHR